MKYSQNRDIKKRLVEYLRMIYKLNSEWLNADFEVIELSGDNSPEVYEQYPWDQENYPIVVVGGLGGNPDDWAVDSFLQNIWRNWRIGAIPRDYRVFDTNTDVAFGVKVSEYDLKIRTVGAALKHNVSSDYTVEMSLMSSNNGIPDTVLASGSVDATQISTILKWCNAELIPEYTLVKDTEYFVKLHLTQGSYGNYYLMIDNTPDEEKTLFPRLALNSGEGWSVSSGSTPLGLIQGPVYKQLGGGVHANFSLFIEAKDLATVQKISELTFVYLNLLRHSNVQMRSRMDYPNSTGMEFDRMSNLADLGITVVDVNKSNESVRERGNDRIFSITLTTSCYGRWTETFEMPTIESIEEIIDNY